MNNLSHFCSEDLKSLTTYLEYCKENLEELHEATPTDGLKERVMDVIEEIEEIHEEEMVERYHGNKED